MRKHAFLNENLIVILIKNIDEIEYAEEIKNYSAIIDIHDDEIQPELGWVLNGNKLIPPDEYSPFLEKKLQERIKKARLFGTELVGEMVDRVGAKNLLNNKTELQIIEVATVLGPIRALLEGGALVTARTQINAAKNIFPYLTTELEYASNKIATFLGLV